MQQTLAFPYQILLSKIHAIFHVILGQSCERSGHGPPDAGGDPKSKQEDQRGERADTGKITDRMGQ